MKYFVMCTISLFLGVILGGIGPKQELRELKNQGPSLSLSKDSSQNCSSTIGSDLAQLMGQGAHSQPSPSKTTRNSLGDRDPHNIAKENPKAVEIAEKIDQEQEALEEELQQGLPDQEELETARAALELRRAQARAALIEGADPNEDQLLTIDQAVQDMNDSLLSLTGELTDIIESGEDPDRREAMAFAAEALDTMIAAEDTMRDTLSPEQIESLDDGALNPFSYISPDLIDTLEGLDR